ncbi:MAG TPA: hypothetical protein VGE74_29390 [Gemmata sp.]
MHFNPHTFDAAGSLASTNTNAALAAAVFAPRNGIGAAPVTSVNGYTGAVSLSAADVGADPSGTAAAAVSAHEAAADPHPQYAQESALATVATTGAYADLSGTPTLGTAAALNVPATGNAATGQVVKGNDTRLTDARTPTAHTHSAADITSGTLAAGRMPAMTGDATSSAGSVALTLATVATAGTSAYPASITIDAKGRVTSITAGTAPALPRGYIDGHIITRPSTTTITVGAGACRSVDNDANLSLTSAVTKNTGGWTAGSGGGGLDTGSIGANNWYHVYTIAKADGTTDVLYSLSATAPTLPSGYIYKRRIGSVKTNGSSQFIDFVQRPGGAFYWLSAVADVSAANPGTSAVTRTLTVPTLVRVKALVSVVFTAAAAADNPGGIYLSDPSLTDVAADTTNFTVSGYTNSAAVNQVGAQAEVWTNTSAQIRSRLQLSGSGTTLFISTRGWVDPRGQDA